MLLTPASRVLLEKAAVPQLVKSFPAFYGRRNFFTTAQHHLLVPILSQINPVHARPSCLFKLHFNIMLLSISGCSK